MWSTQSFLFISMYRHTPLGYIWILSRLQSFKLKVVKKKNTKKKEKSFFIIISAPLFHCQFKLFSPSWLNSYLFLNPLVCKVLMLLSLASDWIGTVLYCLYCSYSSDSLYLLIPLRFAVALKPLIPFERFENTFPCNLGTRRSTA